MNLAADLLAQAVQLARQEPGRPRQASLRRAVSTAYYSLFHLLVDEATRRLVRGSGRRGLQQALARAFVHGEMREAAHGFAGGPLSGGLRAALGRADPELIFVARVFVALQEARHAADYDPARRFSREECRDFVQRAERAFTAWRAVRTTLAADAFLVALLADRRLRG